MSDEQDFLGDHRDLEIIVPALLKTLPTVGGVVSRAWTSYRNNQRLKRVEELLARIKAQLSILGGVTLSEFSTSPAGMQFFENVLHRVERESCESKREKFANLIVMSWVSAEPSVGMLDEANLFADATSCFTDAHFAVLMRLYENGVDGCTTFKQLVELIQANTPTDRDELGLLVMFDLCTRFVFARRGWGKNDPEYKGKLVTSGNLSPENMAFKCNHAITQRGRRYVDFVVRGPESLSQGLEKSPPV